MIIISIFLNLYTIRKILYDEVFQGIKPITQTPLTIFHIKKHYLIQCFKQLLLSEKCLKKRFKFRQVACLSCFLITQGVKDNPHNVVVLVR